MATNIKLIKYIIMPIKSIIIIIKKYSFCFYNSYISLNKEKTSK